MFGIGRRFFYQKYLKNARGADKPGEFETNEQKLRGEAFINKELLKIEQKSQTKKTNGRKTLWYSRAAALLMIAVLVSQMFSFVPGMFAGNIPDKEGLWMYPEIEYNGRTIHDGMTIPVGAEMNAKFEFLIDENAFPVEVFLPDVLRAEADEYPADAFNIYGQKIPGAEVIVNEKGEIFVHFDAPETDDGDNANTDGTAGSGNNEPDYECDESCDHDAGSSDDNEHDLSGFSSNIFGENDENPDGKETKNFPSGSIEPAVGSVISDSKNSPSSDSTLSGETDSNSESCNDDGMSINSSSASMFSDIGPSRASANDTPTDPLLRLYRIVFELPVYFDLEKLPEQPEPDFEAYNAALEAMEDGDEDPELHTDPWLVKVLNTEYDSYLGRYEAELIEVVIEPEEVEFEEFATAFDIVPFNVSDLADGKKEYEPFINWNDNSSPRRPRSATGDDTPVRSLPLPPVVVLQLQYSTDGGTTFVNLTAQQLVDWGFVTGPTALADANAILTPEIVSRLGSATENEWLYLYDSLPSRLFQRVEEQVDPEDPDKGTHMVERNIRNLQYRFTVTTPDNPTYVTGNYIEAVLTELPRGDYGYRYTIKENFSVTKEWKDGNMPDGSSRYNTRPAEDALLTNLELYRQGITPRIGTLNQRSGLPVPESSGVGVTVTPITNTNKWTITISGMPAFDALGDPYTYYIEEINNTLSIDKDHTLSFPGNARYVTTYENEGNYSNISNRAFNDGKIINRLTDEVPFEVTKIWLDDDSPAAGRPEVKFLLHRYPDMPEETNPRRSYRNSSPVPDGDMDLILDESETPIDFDGEKFDRFDLEGAEYIYYVQELYPKGKSDPSGEGKYRYTSESKYPGLAGVAPEDLPTWWQDHDISGITFDGGVLYNKRVGSADLSVTKEWIAAAKQDMEEASITVTVQRKLYNEDDSAYTTIETYVLDGFRAEIMTLTHPFSGLDRYNELGVEYVFRISESSIYMDPPDESFDIDISKDDSVLIDGYRYLLNKRPAAEPAGSTAAYDHGSVHLTNTLDGEVEIRVRKIWNGLWQRDGSPDRPWSDVTFTVDRLGTGGGPILASNSGVKIHWEDKNKNWLADVAPAAKEFRIPVSKTWGRPAASASGAEQTATFTQEGEWLVITGLPRYDDRGREIEYRVRESTTHSGYHSTFSQTVGQREGTEDDGDKEGEWIGTLESTLINTPSYGTGRYVRVSKVWADDGDLACRGPVLMELYWNGGTPGSTAWQPTRVGSVVLDQGNDWTDHIRLNGVLIPATEDTPAIYDTNYNNYIVKEARVDGVAVSYPNLVDGLTSNFPALTAFGVNPPPPPATPATVFLPTRMGEVKTNAHYYNVFGNYRETTGLSLNTDFELNPGDQGYYTPDTNYRTSYTFKNVRTGKVRITIDKSFVDNKYNEDHELNVEFTIDRYKNYTWDPILPSVVVNTIWSGRSLGDLHWDNVTGSGRIGSPAGPGYFEKYDEDGVLIHYVVRETAITPLGGTRIDITGDGYTLANHQYSISMSVERVWGDHTSEDGHELEPANSPRPDLYMYKVTNQRSYTYTDFTVHKIWHDVTRTTPVIFTWDGRPMTSAELEARNRPDIYLRLWQKVGEDGTPELYGRKSPTEPGDGYYDHYWTTRSASSTYENTYYWTCVFDNLERYTSNGTEIFYYVDEVMPNRGDAYETFYYNTGYTTSPMQRPDVTGTDWLSGTTGLAGMNIRDLPLNPITGLPLLTPEPNGVTNGGTIINRRIGEREMHGRKIWTNVPLGFSAESYPEIDLQLMRQNDKHSGEGLDDGFIVPVSGMDGTTPLSILDAKLENRETEIHFNYRIGGAEAKLPMFDRYGIMIQYRAKELGSTTIGYNPPEYNDFTMDVRNVFNVSGPGVEVRFTKEWDFSPYTATTLPAGQEDPQTTFQLYRYMTTNGTTPIPDSERLVAEKTIKLSDGHGAAEIHTFEGDDFKLNGQSRLPPNENRLLRYGYNGQKYLYVVKEKDLPGYDFDVLAPVPPAGSTVVTAYDDDLKVDVDTWTFNTKNTYDGAKHGDGLIRLHGTKDWRGEISGYNTRPPDVQLKVYRSIGPNGARTDITNAVNIEWTRRTTQTADLNDHWTYEVFAKPLAEQWTAPPDPERLYVGPDGGVSGAKTLYRFALTGDEYYYYVEEVSQENTVPAPTFKNNHYAIEVKHGVAVNTSPAVPPSNLLIRATTSSLYDGCLEASFTNRIRTVSVNVTKEWLYNTGGDPEPINTHERDLMLANGLTFKVQVRETVVAGDWSSAVWVDVPVSIAPLMTLNRVALDGLTIDENGLMVINYTGRLPMHGATPLSLPAETGIIYRQYRLVETQVSGKDIAATVADFDNTAAGTNIGGFDVTYFTNIRVKNTLQTIPLKITKIWDDNNNNDGLRPQTVTFRITRDDTLKSMTVTLSAQDNTVEYATVIVDEGVISVPRKLENTFYVPKYQADGETLVSYTIEELVGGGTEEGSEGFARSVYTLANAMTPPPEENQFKLADPRNFTLGDVPANHSPNFVFENSHGKLRFNLTVSKTWDDPSIATTIGTDRILDDPDDEHSNFDEIRPKNNQVSLTIQWTVAETPRESDWATMVKGPDADAAGVLTAGQEPTITLGAGGTRSGPGDWEHKWTGLLARHDGGTGGSVQYYKYRIIERDIDGNVIKAYTTNFDYTDSGDNDVITYKLPANGGTVDIPITNELDTVELVVNKDWDDKGSAFSKRDDVNVQLYYRLDGVDAAGEWTEAEIAPITLTGVKNQSATPPAWATNRWTGKFENLPKEDSMGNPYIYTVKEVSIGVTPVPATSSVFPLSYSSSVGSTSINATTGNQTVAVTNTLETRGDIKVNIVWDDVNNQDFLRPASVWVRLIMDMGLGAGSRFVDMELKETENGWSGVFTNLPRYRADGTTESTYHIVELIEAPTGTGPHLRNYIEPEYQIVASLVQPAETGYASTPGTLDTASRAFSGNIAVPATPSATTDVYIKNKRVPTVMSIEAEKLWTPAAESFGARPPSILLQLQVSTSETTGFADVTGQRITLNAPSWTGNFDNLPVSRNTSGTMYNYGAGGTDTITIAKQTGGTSQQLYYRVVELNADGTVKLPGHTASYSYTSNGSATPNSVRGVPGNDSASSLTAGYKAIVTNTRENINIEVQKTWNDKSSVLAISDASKTQTVTIQLQYRLLGSSGAWADIAATQTLSHLTSWKATFAGLPIENYEGTKYEYTVKEVAINGVAVTGTARPFGYSVGSVGTVNTQGAAIGSTLNIQVTNVLETRDISVSKTWLDGTNQDGLRPGSVQIILIKDMGTTFEDFIGPITINGPGWTGSFNNLPVFRPEASATPTRSTYHILEVPLGIDGYTLQYQAGGSTSGGVAYSGSATSYGGIALSGSLMAALVGDTNDSVEVINSYTPKVMDVSVTKTWVDEDNDYQTRPAQVRYQLYKSTNADGITGKVAVGTPVTVTVSSTTPHTWSNQPIMENGNPIYYSVEELDIDGNTRVRGYSAQYTYTTAGGASVPSVRGNIGAASKETQNAVVTNKLDAIDITVEKTWDDHDNIYGQRPAEVTFILQRRTGTADFVNVVSGPGADVVTHTIDNIDTSTVHGATRNEDSYTFTGLPRVTTSGALWEYRVIETSVTYHTPDPNRIVPVERYADALTDLTTGTIGDVAGSHYEYESETKRDATTGYYTTEVTNTLVVEEISISGTKRWHDNINLGTRPDKYDLELVVWYWDVGESEWKDIDPDDLDPIVWSDGNDEWEWKYTITGFGLLKYEPGSTNLRIYNVQEILPDSDIYELSELTHPSSDPDPDEIPRQTNSTFGVRVPDGDNKDHIVNANFTNSVTDAVTSLWATKTRDYGPNGPFKFKVYFSGRPITETNPGTLYINHFYRTYNGTLAQYEALPDKTGVLSDQIEITDNGEITLYHGQSFILEDIPKGVYFNIVEVEHPSFTISEASLTLMRGRLIPNAVAPTSVLMRNYANREISIINETPNEGESNKDQGLTNAGGWVTVETPSSQNPEDGDERESDEEVENALAVLWKPEVERYWVYGNEITIKWQNFETPDIVDEVTISNYMDPDGNLKSIAECEIDNPVFRTRFPNAKLDMRNGAVRLELCVNVENMPQKVEVFVVFLPTIAVRNVTEGYVGGQVRVECAQSGGNLNNQADGLPSYNNGKPYVGTTKVYGLPDPGYMVDWDHIVLRNLNDLDGPYEIADLDEDGYFTIHLSTWIAGAPDVVEKNGRATEGSIIVEILHHLPVPLQVDLRFIPEVLSGTTGGSGAGDSAGGLPRTGVESVISTLVLGLITSVIAGAAVAMVIWRMGAKERRVKSVGAVGAGVGFGTDKKP